MTLFPTNIWAWLENVVVITTALFLLMSAAQRSCDPDWFPVLKWGLCENEENILFGIFVETVLPTQWHLYMSSAITSSIALKMYENSIIYRKRLCFALFFLLWDYHVLSQTWDWISRLIVCNGSQNLQIYFQLISGVVLSHLVISSFDFEWLAVECLYTLVLFNFTLSHCFPCY